MNKKPGRLRKTLPIVLCIALGMVLTGWVSLAAPYTPASDDEVLERLPPGLRSADLRREREDLASDPENLRDSVSMAWSYLETTRVEGDQRFLGYAQSILGPWWNQASPPAEVRIVRAVVFATSFEFERALAELDAVLALDPRQGQALSTRLDVCLARGDFEGARETCERAKPAWTPIQSALANARCERMSAGLDGAVELLETALSAPVGISEAEWHAGAVLLTELALQRGRWEEVEARFAELRRIGKREVRVLALRADFLLDRGRPEEVVELLKGETGHDGLAVRLLEAWGARAAPGDDEASRLEELRRQVAKRIGDRRARGDAGVLPEEVRYWTKVRPDAGVAVERAGELWAVRRTLEDARWVLEAARLGGDASLAKRVTDWLERRGIRDARLAAAVARTEVRP